MAFPIENINHSVLSIWVLRVSFCIGLVLKADTYVEPNFIRNLPVRPEQDVMRPLIFYYVLFPSTPNIFVIIFFFTIDIYNCESTILERTALLA